MRTPLFVANWKMHKSCEETTAFALNFERDALELSALADIAIAPQTLALSSLVQALRGFPVSIAAQNCGQTEFGAFTGESSPVSLCSMGVKWVLLGHSERRWVYGETDALIASRFKAAIAAGLTPILCIGEKLEERQAGKTFEVIEQQLRAIESAEACARSLIAYEPVWAIGTGETASPAQAQEVHAFIRRLLSSRFSPHHGAATRILYGGSAKAANASELMAQPDVDGLLVGGASLDPNGFAELIRNGVRSTP
jgi:triosephosphate isomerase (TIM)